MHEQQFTAQSVPTETVNAMHDPEKWRSLIEILIEIVITVMV